jgi:NitT/TauT family transport system permease protein
MRTSEPGQLPVPGHQAVLVDQVQPAVAPRPVSRNGRRALSQLSSFDWAARSIAIVALLAVWQVMSLLLPAGFMPAPITTFSRVARLVADGEFARNAIPTVLRVFSGFALALLSGTLVGMAMGARRGLESLFEFYILIGLTIPGLAWAILALMWFGITEIAPVFAVFAVVTPMLAVNMWQGTKALDHQLLEMARAFHVPRRQVISEVVLPQLLPYVLAASRFGFALGWKVVVLSEMFGLSSGIGYELNRSFSNYSLRDVLAWTISFTLIMFVFEYGVLRPLEGRLLRWRPVVTI